MGSFCHTPKGVIVINGEYSFSLELFKTLEPEYDIPEEMTWRIYNQEEKIHTVSNKKIAHTEEFPWEEGDRYINRLPDLLYLQQHERLKEEERKEYVRRLKNNAK